MLIKQEIQRKCGYAIQVDEEHLRVQLDTIQSELNAPTQFKVSACNPSLWQTASPWRPHCVLYLLYLMFQKSQHIERYFAEFPVMVCFFVCFDSIKKITSSSHVSGPFEWINVSNPDAEPLWSREVGGTLQCRRRPAARNQTSKSRILKPFTEKYINRFFLPAHHWDMILCVNIRAFLHVVNRLFWPLSDLCLTCSTWSSSRTV